MGSFLEGCFQLNKKGGEIIAKKHYHAFPIKYRTK